MPKEWRASKLIKQVARALRRSLTPADRPRRCLDLTPSSHPEPIPASPSIINMTTHSSAHTWPRRRWLRTGLILLAAAWTLAACSLLPTPEPTPTPTPTPTPVPLGFPGSPVTRNDDWEPVIREFDGIEMALVPVGCFMMGSEDGDWDEVPVNEQCFDEPFWIDVYEVTIEQYGSPPPARFWTVPDYPRNLVPWVDAVAHCESRGARLPTEAEWEYAARGPDNLIYPWGNEFVAENVVASPDYYRRPGGPTSVGSRPGGVSWVGAYDMSGNTWEWTSSIYAPYPYDATDGREASAAQDSTSPRVTRGGCWYSILPQVDATNRLWINPTSMTDYHGGLRCARDYEP
jgi:hypothetical protein